MFVYTIEHVIGGLVIAAVVGFYGYYYLSIRWAMWKGRKILQRQLADEKDKLMKEIDEVRLEYPTYDDATLEQIVRRRRMRNLMTALEKNAKERNDNPVRHQTLYSGSPVELGLANDWNGPITMNSQPAYENVREQDNLKEQGKGNDESTGNFGTTRSSGHRTDRDDSPCTQKGWQSERLESGSGWGSESSSRHSAPDTGGGDSGSTPSCD